MFHLLAYSASLVTAVETDTLPVQDPVITIVNNHFMPQTPMYGVFGTSMGTNLLRSRIQTPTLLQVTTPFLRPINATLIGGSLHYVDSWLRNPIMFQQMEEIAILNLQNAGANQQITSLLAISPQMITPGPSGPLYRIRGTGTTTVVAHAWTQCPITWQNALPAGIYSVVGLEALSVTGQAARLIFQQQVMRPGCMATVNPGDISDPIFRNGVLGEWGRFTQTALPSVEMLCNAADTAQEVYLDIVRIG